MQTSGIRNAIVGSLIWLIVGVVAGFVVVARLGDYGSIAHLLIGSGIGLAGAISHAALSASAAFRRGVTIWRAFLNWLLGYSIFLAVFFFLIGSPQLNNPRFWPEAFEFFVVHTGGPMLILSLVVALITRERRSGGVT